MGTMTRGSAPQNNLPFAGQVSMGASLVLLFWTYFETRPRIPPPQRSSTCSSFHCWKTRSIGIHLSVLG